MPADSNDFEKTELDAEATQLDAGALHRGASGDGPADAEKQRSFDRGLYVNKIQLRMTYRLEDIV